MIGVRRMGRMIREMKEDFRDNEKAFSTSLVGAALGIVILVIVCFDVAVPVINDAIACASLTGTSATIANLIPTFIILGVFVMTAVVFVIRWL